MTPRRLIEPARLAGAALLHSQSDERLVDLTRAGNDRAFEAIVARYRRPLLRHCASILPPERAEDAVQQAFLNAYKAIAAGEAEIKLRPWLYRVAHNASLNLLRQNGWNHEQIPEDFDGVVQPPQAVERSEHLRQVIQGVKELPERQRDAIVLRELEGRSYEEIAAALGVTDGAVRQLLNRARTTLRGAATALTPPQLLERVAERIAADGGAAARIAEISLGAGGMATLAKVGAAVVVAGAVAGGVAAGPLQHGARGAEAAELVQGGSGASGSGALALGDPFGLHRGRGSSPLAQALELVRHGGRVEPGVFGPGGDLSLPGAGGSAGGSGPLLLAGGGSSGPGGGGSSGPGSDGSGSSGPGSGGGDNSGSGSSGSGSSGSGSGDSGGHSGSGSSGSGSGSSGSDGSSGSGSSGSGSSGSGSSGSGDSGSGSGSSGSGSSGSGSSGSGSGSSGSGSSVDDSSGSGHSGSG